MYGKNKGSDFTGIDIQEEMVEMANRSALLNGVQEKVRFELCDVKEVKHYFKGESFDVIVTNPPYMKAGNGLINPDIQKAVSRHEIACTVSVLWQQPLLAERREALYDTSSSRLPISIPP